MGVNVLGNLIPLPVVSQPFGTTIEKPEDQQNENRKLGDVKYRRPVDFTPKRLSRRWRYGYHDSPIPMVKDERSDQCAAAIFKSTPVEHFLLSTTYLYIQSVVKWLYDQQLSRTSFAVENSR